LCALFYSYEKYVAFCVGVYKQRHNEKLLQWFIYVRKWNEIEKKVTLSNWCETNEIGFFQC